MAWVLEYVYGPKALNSPDDLHEVWARRAESVRALIAERRAAAQGDTIETLLLEHLLAFWLVNQGDHVESLPMLDHNIGAWHERWPGDPLIADATLLRVCAQANLLLSEPPAPSAARPDPSSIERLLLEGAARLDIERPRSPVHLLVLNRLADVQQLLERPQDAEATRGKLKALMDETPWSKPRASPSGPESRLSSQ
jgi:hypothetical protein